MKTIFKTIPIVLFGLLVICFTGCKKDSSVPMIKTNSIADVAVSNPDFSTLVLALKKTGLDVALADSKSQFTVFAPTNAAFASLLTELKVASLNDIPTETLTKVLLYHVKSGKALASQITTGYYSSIAAGPVAQSFLSMFIDMTNAKINGRSKITKTDIAADNGIIHVIDKVLLPMSVVDNAIANPMFSSLVAAVTKANLVTPLADNTKTYTVFAPTNDAFSALLTALKVTLNDLSGEALSPILLNHVLSGYIPAASVTAGYFPTLNTAFGKNVSLQIATTGGVVLNNSSKVIATDVVATNGIIHVIDKVLLPPSVVDLALQNPMFSTLVSALVKADLVTALTGAGPFTVFAPTNDAFAALFTSLKISGVDALTKEQLTPILLSHVVSGNVQSGSLSSGSVQTLNGQKSLDVMVSGGAVTIDGSVHVVKADVQGTNGVVHVIDKVISAPIVKSNSITDVAASNPDFSTLVLALKKTGLDVALADNMSEFTVFAPTNAAFASLLTELKVASIDDIPTETLTKVLLYHVKSGKALASQITTGYYSSLSAGPVDESFLSMFIDMTNTKINGRSKITNTDIVADNGVIHVIDKVLLPMSVVDNAIANPMFSSLVAAVVKANLVAPLSDNSKTYTLFAPTDEAFSALLSELKLTLDDVSGDALAPILLYHVLSGYIPAASVTAGYFPTLNTAFDKNVSLQIATTGGVLLNNSSKVIATDVVATNGIIHVIDKVLLPPSVVDIALQNSNFSTLVAALVKADLVGTLSNGSPFTVFAPTNDAFAALFTALKISGVDALTKEQLTPILLAHVVSGNIQSGSLSSGLVPTYNDAKSLNVVVSGGAVTIDGSVHVVKADIQGSNGVVHVIDKVIIP